jgi:hypothetical protein
MNDNLMVYTSTAVYDGCEIKHRVHDRDSADVTCGTGHTTFEVEFTADGLREFVQHCTAALAEMDAIHARENSEGDGSQEAVSTRERVCRPPRAGRTC